MSALTCISLVEGSRYDFRSFQDFVKVCLYLHIEVFRILHILHQLHMFAHTCICHGNDRGDVSK